MADPAAQTDERDESLLRPEVEQWLVGITNPAKRKLLRQLATEQPEATAAELLFAAEQQGW